MLFDFLLNEVFVTYFEGEGEGSTETDPDSGSGEGDGDGGEGGAATATKSESKSSEGSVDLFKESGIEKKDTFSQTEVNDIMRKERKKHEERTKRTIKELEELKKTKSMTEQDRAKLQSRIEGLQDELLTKEQLAAKEREKMKNKHTEELKKLQSERDNWANRFTSAEISRAIHDAASAEGAFNGEHIGALLRPNTQLVEDLDNEGKPKGTFTPRVKFQDTGEEGEPLTLDLTVKEAVKRMKETPEKYGYLFKSTASGGVGGEGSTGKKGEIDPSKMTPDQYRKHREKFVQ